ncbi:MAG: YxeA family protein [Oscillospiraceae bacterium]|nr:YxeA family protein [Oscillospiraceae bacterium]
MNKGLKIGLIILGVIILVVLVIIFKQYYDNTYVGSYYYVQVPSNQDTTIEEWNDASKGTVMVKGKQYQFTAYNENGEARVVEFSIRNVENEASLLQPNTYLKVNASKNRVIGWQIVQRQDVPEAALKYVEENHQ